MVLCLNRFILPYCGSYCQSVFSFRCIDIASQAKSGHLGNNLFYFWEYLHLVSVHIYILRVDSFLELSLINKTSASYGSFSIKYVLLHQDQSPPLLFISFILCFQWSVWVAFIYFLKSSWLWNILLHQILPAYLNVIKEVTKPGRLWCSIMIASLL